MNRLLVVTVLCRWFSGSEGDPVEEGGRDGPEDYRASQGRVRGQGRGHRAQGIHQALLMNGGSPHEENYISGQRHHLPDKIAWVLRYRFQGSPKNGSPVAIILQVRQSRSGKQEQEQNSPKLGTTPLATPLHTLILVQIHSSPNFVAHSDVYQRMQV